jgi:hypothetical protein
VSDHKFEANEAVTAVRGEGEDRVSGHPCKECGNLEDAHTVAPKPVRKPRAGASKDSE